MRQRSNVTLPTCAPILRGLCAVSVGMLLTIHAVSCRQAVEPAPASQTDSVAQETHKSLGESDKPTTESPTTETWDAVFIGGTQVGSVRTTTTPHGDAERSLVSIVSDTQLAIARFGDVSRMRVVTESIETADGVVHGFSHRTESGAFPIVVEGRVESDRVVVNTRTAGKERASEFPWSADHGGFFAVEESVRRTPMEPGEKRTLTLLMPGLAGVQSVTAVLEAEQLETAAMLEGSQTLLKIKQELRATDLTVEGYCWMDPHGELVKSSVTDLRQETYRTTRARALAPTTSHGFDLGFDTIVRVTPPLPRPWETTQVVYEATLSQRNPAETFASDASQRVESLDERRARITVRAIRPRQPADIPAETPPADDDRNANSLIQSDDERVRQLAGTIATAVTDPWQIAVALEKWVHDGIRKKNFSQGFATAADVAQSLEGDCTEHAVLLAALCRARQIPARVCIGLVYSSADQGFAFHMWNEAWIADRWIPLDATLGRGGTGADHLKLQHSSLSSEQAEGAVLSVLQVMNQLQLQILDVQ